MKILISKKQIQNKIQELANSINKDYEGKDITVICVLKGAVIFTVDLTKKLNSNINYEFIEISSYDGTKSTGNIKLNKDISNSIENKDVLIIEDIIDTGRSLSYLKKYLLSKKPNSLKICTLVDKKEKRIINVDVDYNGFVIEDKFIIGYGFDYNQKYRNLEDIYYIEKDEFIN